MTRVSALPAPRRRWHRPLACAVLLLACLLVACGARDGSRLLLSVPAGAPVAAAAGLYPAQEQPVNGGVGGKLLFVREGNIWLWADGRARQLTTGGSWRQPRWSPDGAEIAYVYRSTNFSEIFVMNADGSNNRRLTMSQSASLSDNDWVFQPTWSPNGTQLAFVTDGSSYNPTLWVMNKDGSGRRQLLSATAFQEAADSMSWAPDGRRLAVTAFGAEISQIVLLDITRGVTQAATEAARGAFDPAWAPDNLTLAYAVREGNRTDLRLRRLDGSPEVEVSRGGLSRAPAWSPEGRQLAFISSRGGSFELYVVDIASTASGLAARNERQLTRELNIDAVSGLSWGR